MTPPEEEIAHGLNDGEQEILEILKVPLKERLTESRPSSQRRRREGSSGKQKPKSMSLLLHGDKQRKERKREVGSLQRRKSFEDLLNNSRRSNESESSTRRHSKSPDDSIDAIQRGEKEKSRSRRQRNSTSSSSASNESTSLSSRNISGTPKFPRRKPSSMRLSSTKEKFLEGIQVPSKASTKGKDVAAAPLDLRLSKQLSTRSLSLRDHASRSNKPPKRNPREAQGLLSASLALRDHKQSSSRSLRDLKMSSSRSLQIKKPKSSSNRRSDHQEPKSSNQSRKSKNSSRSPGKAKKNSATSFRQEIKETLSAFPELLDIVSPETSPISSDGRMIEKDIKQALKVELLGSDDAQVGLMSPKDKSSSRNRRKRSPKQEKNRVNDKPLADDVKKLPDDLAGFEDIELPPLVDDSTQREDLGGKKGDKSWNICEDTPGGHAPEKLTIVTGVDHYESMDEDEDILDDEDQGDDILQDSTTLMSPTQDKKLHDSTIKEMGSFKVAVKLPPDRFSPAYQNSDVWKSSDLDSSGAFSMQSEQLAEEDADTISELATAFTDDRTLTNHTFETFMLEQDCKHQILKAELPVKPGTPVTLKRAGGRSSEENNDPSFPSLHNESAIEEEGMQNEDCKDTTIVPEDHVIGLNDAIDSESPLTSPAAKSGSNSTGRSSRLRNSAKSSRRGRRMNPIKGTMIPAVVPSMTSPRDLSPSVGRSLLTCSIMSSPTNPSMTQVKEPAPSNNRTLQSFVAREFSSASYDDDHTLGASTISTNFTSTQRTTGDNTVSTRSLFRSNVTQGSDMMKIPQRRHAYDSEEEEGSAGNSLSIKPSRETTKRSVEQQQAIRLAPIEKSSSSKRVQNTSLSETMELSPHSRAKVKKKRSKRNLFGKAASWKGLVSDDDDGKHLLDE